MAAVTHRAKLRVVCRYNDPVYVEAMTTRNEHITCVMMIFADGSRIEKPLLILPLKEMPDIDPAIADAFSWRGQSKGWITNEIFSELTEKIIIPEYVRRRAKHNFDADRRGCLLLDGHASHMTEAVRIKLEAAHIDLKVFHPHASHINQPLDLECFMLMKKDMAKVRERIFLSPFPPSCLLTVSPHSRTPQTIQRMVDGGADLSTAVARRNATLEACFNACCVAFSPIAIKSSFSRAGIWPACKDPPLNNPVLRCTQGLVEAKKRRRTGTAISKEILMDAREIPSRRRKTLKERTTPRRTVPQACESPDTTSSEDEDAYGDVTAVEGSAAPSPLVPLLPSIVLPPLGTL